jgi:exosome complex exonuclease DIS3/RRP44
MLPKLLTEVLCSLVSKVDRLAFSIFWEFTPEGDLVKTYFSKSIIHSKASLHY